MDAALLRTCALAPTIDNCIQIIPVSAPVAPGLFPEKSSNKVNFALIELHTGTMNAPPNPLRRPIDDTPARELIERTFGSVPKHIIDALTYRGVKKAGTSFNFNIQFDPGFPRVLPPEYSYMVLENLDYVHPNALGLPNPFQGYMEIFV
ncbi:unnamed protein product [Chrysodeixis includens]|uniref:Uncharacterized protein n=1 Tax=Chrysodeixis includens TaxID=689277 RepID=A0A9P0BKQ7_CHRIL|nr:unnamed protein product [Chrysodeixis includens]